MLEMKMYYVATHIHKEIAEENYDGEETTSRECVMHEPIDVAAGSLAELMSKIGDEYGLVIDSVFVADDPPRYFDFDRYEDADANAVNLAPGTADHDRFRDGKLKVWHAIYSFAVERRIVIPVERSEFERAGIELQG